MNQVKSITFSILSKEEINDRSVLGITDGKTDIKGTKVHQGIDKDTPGPNNKRLGVLSSKELCVTCGKTNIQCPGHFGHINLEIPVYHPNYVKTIVRILNCVCVKCYNCRKTKEYVEFIPQLENTKGPERLKQMMKACSTVKICWNCKQNTPKYIYDKKLFNIAIKEKDGTTIIVATSDVLDILSHISNETLLLIGFNNYLIDSDLYKNNITFPSYNVNHRHQIRPESFIFTKFAVLPRAARPHSCVDGTDFSDDLTEVIVAIVKLNESLKDLKPKKDVNPQVHRKQIEAKLTSYVQIYINNKATAGSGSSYGTKNITRQFKTINQRLSSKDGQLRKELMSKRVNHSSRTVIGSGPDLELNQVGVPFDIAKIIVMEEIVKKWNIKGINNLLVNGQIKTILIKHPLIPERKFQLEMMIEKEGKNTFTDIYDVVFYFLKKQRKDHLTTREDPKLLILVYRYLRDNDICILNRQPTLRIEGMMAMRVKLVPHKTFRFNLGVCSAYNADFDGDEMNIHFCQNHLARMEAEMIMDAARHIITPQRNAPIIAPIQDSLLGGYLITKKTEMVEWKRLMNLITRSNPLGVEKGWKDFLTRAEKYYPAYIVSGNMVGDVCPGTLAISVLFPRDFYYERKNNVSSVEPVVKIEYGIWLCGQGDKSIFGDKAKGVIHVIHQEYGFEKCKQYIDAYTFLTGNWLTSRGFSVGIMDCQTKSNNVIKDKIAELMLKADVLLKGKEYNSDVERQINTELNSATNIGQKLAESELYGGRDNAFTSMALSGAKGKGVNISQIIGMLGQQNVKGKRIYNYLSNQTRTLPHFKCNDNSPMARGFVDRPYLHGIRPEHTYHHAMGGREGVVSTSCSTQETGYIQRQGSKKVENEFIGLKLYLTDGNGYIYQYSYNDWLDPYKLMYPSNSSELSFFDPILIARRLTQKDKYVEELSQTEIDNICSSLKFPGFDFGNYFSFRNTMKVREQVSRLLSKVILTKDKRARLEFAKVIQNRFESSIINPGEAVGLIACSSISEPITQQTLDVFHLSGMAGKTVTMGVPRIKELLHISKTLKTPSCIVFIKNLHIDKTLSEAEQYISVYKNSIHIQQLLFSDVVIGSPQLKWKGDSQPPICPLIDKYKKYKENVEDWWEIEQVDEEWCLEFTISSGLLFKYRVDMEEIQEALSDALEGCIVVCSPASVGKIKIYCGQTDIYHKSLLDRNISANALPFFFLKEIAQSILLDTKIRGIDGIKKIFPTQKEGEWCVETEGTNLIELLGHPDVDPTKTISDDPREIYSCFGLYAARNFLIEELIRVIGYDGTYINEAHISLLVDTFIRRGALTGIGRHGQDPTAGPLSMACFEEAQKTIENAAMFGIVDSAKSVSAKIALGQNVLVGSAVYN